jgi:glycerophosphoryl diester phosphodiesterase
LTGLPVLPIESSLSRHEKEPGVAKVLGQERLLVIGHRGYAQFAPENTIPSFDLAIAAGVDLVELDCHQTKDGVLVVIHDRELRRTTNARQLWKRRRSKVHTRTAHELQQLDAGSWFAHQFAGARIPTLAEAIEHIAKKSIVLIERKSGDAEVLIRLLRHKGVLNRVVVQSFDWAFLHKVHALAPDVVLGALGPPRNLSNGRKPRALFRRLNRSWLWELEKTGAKLAVWNQQVSAKAVRQAHEQGIKVWIYTVNTRQRAKKLLRLRVNGMISDNPSIIWKTLAIETGHG